MNNKIEEDIIEKYRNAEKRLVLLDYDGTLVNYVAMPDAAKLPGYIFDILFNLHDDPQTKIFIITGRRHTDIDRLLNHTSINIIAEHGAMIKESGIWKKQKINDDSWKKTILPIFEQYTAMCPGSFTEEKIFSVTWHYRNAEEHQGYKCSREMISLINNVSNSLNLKLLDGKKVVEVLTNDVGKGNAVRKLFEHNSYDFILSIGDDATDEEMFEYLLHFTRAITIKVGEGATFARFKVDSINEVVTLLKQLLG
jgi:trehalose 6-phosphate synthase/phosphatase